MLSVASHHTRVIVGRLVRGTDLLKGLLEVCTQRHIRCGTLTALGAVEFAEVSHYDTRNKKYYPPRKLAGPLEVLSLNGNLTENQGELAPHLHGVLSRETDAGIEVLGGHIVSAQVFALEYTIIALDDVLLRRGPDKDTGLRLWEAAFEAGEEPVPAAPAEVPVPEALAPAAPEPPVREPRRSTRTATLPAPRSAARRTSRPPVEPEPASRVDAAFEEFAAVDPVVAPPVEPALSPPPEATWQDVIAVTREVAPTEPEEHEPPGAPGQPDEGAATISEADALGEEGEVYDLVPGDIVEHPKFGRSVVERVEGDGEYVQVRLRNHNLVRLSLDVIVLELIAHEDGHQVFRAKIDA
jgi:hypothetical protein